MRYCWVYIHYQLFTATIYRNIKKYLVYEKKNSKHGILTYYPIRGLPSCIGISKCRLFETDVNQIVFNLNFLCI